MTQPKVHHETWNQQPGIRRFTSVAKQLSTPRVLFGTISMLLSYTLGITGGAIAAYAGGLILIRSLTLPSTVFTTIGATFLGTLATLLILAVGFMWTVALTLEWPAETNRLAKALTGSPY